MIRYLEIWSISWFMWIIFNYSLSESWRNYMNKMQFFYLLNMKELVFCKTCYSFGKSCFIGKSFIIKPNDVITFSVQNWNPISYYFFLLLIYESSASMYVRSNIKRKDSLAKKEFDKEKYFLRLAIHLQKKRRFIEIVFYDN